MAKILKVKENKRYLLDCILGSMSLRGYPNHDRVEVQETKKGVLITMWNDSRRQKKPRTYIISVQEEKSKS